MAIEPIDIRHMPGFNASVTNGIDSVSKEAVYLSRIFVQMHDGYDVSYTKYPFCTNHGAMLRVSREGIWRCGELGCDNGCWYPI